MGRVRTKSDLLGYLEDEKVKVIALKGGWGTGKTFLWEEVKETLKDQNIQALAPLYASCFGLQSLDEVKVALLQSSLGKAESTGRGLSNYYVHFKGFFKGLAEARQLPKGVGSLIGGVAGLIQASLVESVTRSRLIVLDDVERGCESLQLDALMGFIDSLKANDSKVLLIFNEEPIEKVDKEKWLVLKEKCIDRELTMMTLPQEAAQIALQDDLPCKESVSKILVDLSVTNIRVVQRVDLVVRTLLRGVDVSSIEKAFIPATVTLAALHYKGVAGGPDISTLVEEWRVKSNHLGYSGESKSGLSNAVAFALKIDLTKDMELLELLLRHLSTGQLMEKEFSDFLEKIRNQENARKREESAHQYMRAVAIDPKMTNDDFISLAEHHKEEWAELPAALVNGIVIDLEKRGGQEVAQEIIEGWKHFWRGKGKALSIAKFIPLDSAHPDIKDFLLEGQESCVDELGLIDAVLLCKAGRFSEKEVDIINSASVYDIKGMIFSLDKENFLMVINFYVGENANPKISGSNVPLLKSGIKKFQQAVQEIVMEDKDKRVIELLEMHLGKGFIEGDNVDEG